MLFSSKFSVAAGKKYQQLLLVSALLVCYEAGWSGVRGAPVCLEVRFSSLSQVFWLLFCLQCYGSANSLEVVNPYNSYKPLNFSPDAI